ncbi:MAG: molybdenum cofactor guanylyltransferase [Gemmatimonadota bacterium]
MSAPYDAARHATAEVLAVLLAGGASTRYGSPKALAEVGGRSILERGLETLDAVAGPAVIVANDPEPFGAAGREIRPDVRPGTGVLGGILTALSWAEELGRDGAVVLACDMPFVPADLLRRLVRDASARRVSLPESAGPRGMEPLCAVYGVGCADAIAQALDRGERAIISFFSDVEVRRLPLAEVRRFGDPERLFFNVNRPEERRRAEQMAGRANVEDPSGGDAA